MSEPGIEELLRELREYLEEQRTAAREGHTLAALHKVVSDLVQRQQQHEENEDKVFLELRGALRGHSLRVGLMEREVDSLRTARESTERHDLELLERQNERLAAELGFKRRDSEMRAREERRDEQRETRARATWWERRWVLFVTGLVSAVAGAAIAARLLGKG